MHRLPLPWGANLRLADGQAINPTCALFLSLLHRRCELITQGSQSMCPEGYFISVTTKNSVQSNPHSNDVWFIECCSGCSEDQGRHLEGHVVLGNKSFFPSCKVWPARLFGKEAVFIICWLILQLLGNLKLAWKRHLNSLSKNFTFTLHWKRPTWKWRNMIWGRYAGQCHFFDT